MLLASGCSTTCVLGQIPAQYVYPDENCKAVLPNYADSVHFKVISGCSGYSWVQVPAPGTIVTKDNSPMTVTVNAVSKSGRQSNSEIIIVNYADTTSPKIIPNDSSFVNLSIDQANEYYSAGDRIISSIMRMSDQLFPPADNVYDKENMVMVTSPGYAITGKGGRSWFWVPVDYQFITK